MKTYFVKNSIPMSDGSVIMAGAKISEEVFEKLEKVYQLRVQLIHDPEVKDTEKKVVKTSKKVKK